MYLYLDKQNIVSDDAIEAAIDLVDVCIQHAAFLAGRGDVQELVADMAKGNEPVPSHIIILASYPGRPAARGGTCGGVVRSWRRSGLVYTVPEVPKIWALVIFGKLLRKTFRKRIRNYRSLFLQQWLFARQGSSMLPCRTPCLQLSAVTSS